MFIVLLFILICIYVILLNFKKDKLVNIKIYNKENFTDNWYNNNIERDF